MKDSNTSGIQKHLSFTHLAICTKIYSNSVSEGNEEGNYYIILYKYVIYYSIQIRVAQRLLCLTLICHNSFNPL